MQIDKSFFKKVFPYIRSKFLMLLPDKVYLRYIFKKILNQKLDFKNPVTFNQKLQWLKIYDRKSEYTNLVDKYEVRKYIANNLGEEYLVPLIGVYNNFDEINFEQLPDKFVLKCTHDSGGVVVCKDKSKLDLNATKKKLEKALKNNYYYELREWPYKNIKPRIICEEFLEDTQNEEINDYKIMCFNGKVRCSFVCMNRNSPSGLTIDFYDENWKLMPFTREYPNSGKIIEKPVNYEKMVEFAERLSKDMTFLRVDFYEVNGKLYFGELTFYPGSGVEEFQPESYDKKLGDWIELPKV